MYEFKHSILIAAPPQRVLAAFFDPVALACWWEAARSVTTPRPLGVYAVEWEPSPVSDDVLGPLGGVFHGTVIEFSVGRSFFVGDAYWLPPIGDAIGPMALDVSCGIDAPGTKLQVRQSGYEESDRWSRYYAVVGRGWQRSMGLLKRYVEQGPEAVAAARAEEERT